MVGEYEPRYHSSWCTNILTPKLPTSQPIVLMTPGKKPFATQFRVLTTLGKAPFENIEEKKKKGKERMLVASNSSFSTKFSILSKNLFIRARNVSCLNVCKIIHIKPICSVGTLYRFN